MSRDSLNPINTKVHQACRTRSLAAVLDAICIARHHQLIPQCFEFLDQERQTPLSIACMLQSTTIASLLISEGADPRCEISLRAAISKSDGPHVNPCLPLLLAHGAKVFTSRPAVDDDQPDIVFNALHYVIDNNEDNAPETVRCLLEHGALLENPDDDEAGAVHMAAAADNIEVLSVLHEMRPECVNDLDSMNLSPLHHAIDLEAYAAIAFLIDNGADLHIGSDRKRSPIDEMIVISDKFPIWIIDMMFMFGSPAPSKAFQYKPTYRVYMESYRRANVDKIVSLASGLHPRLGDSSPVQVLNTDILSVIASHLNCQP